MDEEILVNIESISELQKKIETKGNELVNILSMIMRETSEMNEIYDTPTATIYRDKFNSYLQDRVNYINDNYIGLLEILESIKMIYQDEISKINKAVGDK